MTSKNTVPKDETARELCRLVKACALAKGRSVSTISRLATGSGDTIRRLERNKRITTERAACAARWISENWPDEVPWPSDIPRPTSKRGAA